MNVFGSMNVQHFVMSSAVEKSLLQIPLTERDVSTEFILAARTSAAEGLDMTIRNGPAGPDRLRAM